MRFAGLVVALGLLTPGTALARDCVVPEGAEVLARSGTTTVWEQRDGDGAEAVACSRGRRQTLDNSDEINNGFRLARLRIAGRWLAFVHSYTTGKMDNGRLDLVLVDLRARIPRSVVSLRGAGGNGAPVFGVFVSALKLDRTGRLAWRATADVLPDGAVVPRFDSVGVFDGAGARVVASDAPFAISGLRLEAGRARWVVNGTPGSVALRGGGRCSADALPCRQWSSVTRA